MLHIFYLIKNRRGEVLDPPVVYAATDDSGLAKEFKQTRNMELFYYKKVKCSRKEVIENLDRLRGCKLTKTTFLTKNFFGTKTVDVVVTWKEEQEIFLSSNKIYTNLISPSVINPEIFNDDVYELLESITYTRLWRVKKESTINPFEEESTYLSLKYDELSIFIKSYGWLLKKEDEKC